MKRRKRPIYKVNLYVDGGDAQLARREKVGAYLGTAASGLNALTGGLSSTAGSIFSGLGDVASAIPGIGAIAGPALKAVGAITNGLFGSKMNDQFIAETESNIQNQNNYQIDANTNEDLMAAFSDASLLGNVTKSQVGKEGLFSNKVTKKTKKLNAEIDAANNRTIAAFNAKAQNLDNQQDLQIAANFADLGGFLLRDGGGIHIKKKNRGKFTAYCGGKVTNECIQRGLHSSSSLTRRRANFARNSRKWHAFGGELGTNGTDFTNGVTYFNTGGSHEENPNQGIPQGVDPNGVPNLVEEGEVKYNNYIFSDRIKADPKILVEVGLTKSKGVSYAKLAKRASQESKERPNDPISKLGLEDTMMKLTIAQEMQKSKQKRTRKGNQYGKGDQLNLASLPTIDLPDWKLENPISTDEETALRDRIEETPDMKTYRPTWMRYIPAIGGAVGATASALTPVEKPDYRYADDIIRSRRSIGFTPVSQRLTYKPFDLEYYTNKAKAQSAATRRALVEASAGNRGTLAANLLAADQLAQSQMGELYKKAEEYNQAQREKVAGFNRQTDAMNSQMAMQAASANANSSLGAARMAAILKQNELQRYRLDEAAKRDAIAANLSNLFESLGGIGRENFLGNSIDSNPVYVATQDNRGILTYKRKRGGKLKLKL